MGEIVNAKIDPICLFRGKPFFCTPFRRLSRPEDQIPKSMGDPIELDSPQCSTETPGKGRKDSYGVLRERDEEELPFFPVSRV